jgi:hypothetical protein
MGLEIADGRLVCRITPKSVRRLMAPVPLANGEDLEAETDDEEMKVQLSREQVVADGAVLEEE